MNAASAMGIGPDRLEAWKWSSFLVKNLIPVTLGDVAGSVLFLGAIYWLSFLYKKEKRKKQSSSVGETVKESQNESAKVNFEHFEYKLTKSGGCK